MKDRIREIRKHFGYTQTELAERLSISKSAVCKLESGENQPSNQTIRLICNELNVSYDWLVYGTGQMIVGTDDTAVSMALSVLSGNDEFSRTTFARFARLDSEDWEDLHRIIKKLLKE